MILTLNIWTFLSLWWQATVNMLELHDHGWTSYVKWLILLMNLICINHVWLHNGERHLMELM